MVIIVVTKWCWNHVLLGAQVGGAAYKNLTSDHHLAVVGVEPHPNISRAEPRCSYKH